MDSTWPDLKVTKACADASTSVMPSFTSGMPQGPLNSGLSMRSLKVCPEHELGLGIAHEVKGEIDHVQQIDDRTAPGKLLGREPAAESGDAVPANPGGLGRIDAADRAAPEILPHRIGLGPRAIVEVEHEGLAGLLRGVDHLSHVGGVQGRRLLAEDVLAGSQRLHDQGMVEGVRRDDGDGVEIRNGAVQVLRAAEGLVHAVLLRRRFGGGALLSAIATTSAPACRNPAT